MWRVSINMKNFSIFNINIVVLSYYILNEPLQYLLFAILKDVLVLKTELQGTTRFYTVSVFK